MIAHGTFLLLFIAFLGLIPAPSKGEAYDWLRASVNEFWFNQFVGDCSKNTPPLNISNLGESVPVSCARNPSSIHLNRTLSKNLVADLYFDEALVESTKQNQCQFDYWSALSTRDSESYTAQKAANRKLAAQFEPLKQNIKSHGYNERHKFFPETEGKSATQHAASAQRKIVNQLVEAAYKIAKKDREIKHLALPHLMYNNDPKVSTRNKVEKLQSELAILENTFPFAEDQEVKNFVMYDLVNKMKESLSNGQEPNIAELKEFFATDNNSGFQSRVVERKLKSISKQQSDYADIDGKYDDNYSFKVATVQSGVGAKILNDRVKQNYNFSHLQCDMESKYGKGEKIANTANTVVIAGVTMAVGGGALLLGRLAQIGITSQRSARLAQAISTVTNTTLSASQIAQGLVESCKQPHFQKKDSTVCARVDSVKEKGIDIQINSEIDHSDCLTDMGLAALSGAVAFKAAMKGKQLKQDQQILQLGLRERYDSLTTQIKNTHTLTPTQKKQLIAELDRSISLSSLDSFPRQEFLNSLAKDDPEDLFLVLSQINNGAAGTTWREKVKAWLSTKGFNKKEADELEACMVDNAAKTSKCLSTETAAKS